MIRDWWISIRFDYFVFQGSLLCDRPVSDINRLDKIASQIFLLFLIFVHSIIKQRLLPSFDKNPLTIAISFAILEQSRVILSQAERTRYIVICINLAFSKMFDGIEKPKIPSKFVTRAARYNEFHLNSHFRLCYVSNIPNDGRITRSVCFDRHDCK